MVSRLAAPHHVAVEVRSRASRATAPLLDERRKPAERAQVLRALEWKVEAFRNRLVLLAAGARSRAERRGMGVGGAAH
eukprot:CAMPEP_0119520468 /NCGR_PEP_ID=MMETSP1344-20130328/36477_1 /TAXON_ID=236787 /ORGANISM="Florenciella parvula, Strain CCMP2471" /LENGTH=77 /DNA_ID=CAMNT_0007558357 /DNA_START=29 /DNA_END=259 /DNA_ORIENTATION=-